MGVAIDANKRKTTGRGGDINARAACLTALSHHRPKKEREPNWELVEIMALIKAKADEYERHKLLEDDRTLWKR